LRACGDGRSSLHPLDREADMTKLEKALANEITTLIDEVADHYPKKAPFSRPGIPSGSIVRDLLLFEMIEKKIEVVPR
jgi:hypothetical protein